MRETMDAVDEARELLHEGVPLDSNPELVKRLEDMGIDVGALEESYCG